MPPPLRVACGALLNSSRDVKNPSPHSIPPFEAAKPTDTIVGDTYSFGTLEKHGGVRKYLEVGVLTQPLYWIYGHFTRFLRPGSAPTQGLLEGRRIFKKTKAKGGDNHNARVGYELTFFPCEASTRQQFIFDKHTKEIKTRDYSEEGKGGYVCVGGENEEAGLKGLVLVKCDENLSADEASTSGKFVVHSGSGKIISARDNRRECLVLRKLEGNGHAIGIRGGSQLALGSCEADEKASAMTYNPASSEIIQDELSVCLTTGWPFLQAGSFLSVDKKKVLIFLNEADDEVPVAIQGGDMMVRLSGHSITTAVLAI